MIAGSQMPNFPQVVPFDPGAYPDFLGTIQGNILKSHGRKYSRLVFFRFHERRAANRQLLAAAIRERLVTSAWDQRTQARLGKRDLPFYGLALTHRFFAQAEYESTGPGSIATIIRTIERAPQRISEVGDWWEQPYLDQPDGLWLLAHESKTALDRMQLAVETLLDQHAAAGYAAPENGFLWHDEQPDASGQKVYREPFGFRDGISNSRFIQEPGDPPLTPIEQARVQLPLDQVLIGPEDAELCGGSYMTLAKFEQNVSAFLAFEDAMKLAAGTSHPLPSEPGSLLIGRQRDGVPIAVPPGQNLNDFEYLGGRQNTGCPFHAHIRKSNPRADDTNHAGDPSGKSALFVRRSVIYDRFGQLPRYAASSYPAAPHIKGFLGLLFMGYMRDVANQFETLFNNWYGDPNFPYSATGLKDVLMRGGTPDNDTWRWAGLTVPHLPRFVKNRGVMHLFVPSLPWLARQ